ncbi:MAG: flavodoxin family protein [Patescibacteria group bacterium]
MMIVGLNGSPNKKGRVASMLAQVMREAEKHGTKTRVIHLADQRILPHSGKLNPKTHVENTKDDMPKLQKLVLAADGIIFASPTHWFNVSTPMKAFLDRLTSLEHYGFLLEGKVAGIITYGPQGGALNAALAMLAPLIHMGLSIPPYGLVFDEGRQEKWVKDDLKLLAKNVLLQVKAQKELGLKWGYAHEKYKTSPIELLPANLKKRKK